MSSLLTGDVTFISHNERGRPFSPAWVLNSHNRAFGHSSAMHDDILELDRRNPFTARLDDILDAVGDLKVTVGRDDSDAPV
jgi:hypothetical protein